MAQPNHANPSVLPWHLAPVRWSLKQLPGLKFATWLFTGHMQTIFLEQVGGDIPQIKCCQLAYGFRFRGVHMPTSKHKCSRLGVRQATLRNTE